MPAPNQKQLGKNLQAVRKLHGYKSAKAFAEFLGIKPTAYVEYEQGRVALTYETAWAIADALRITLDELGGREFAAAAASPSDLSHDESVLVGNYRACIRPDRDAVQTMVSALADKAKDCAGAGESPELLAEAV